MSTSARERTLEQAKAMGLELSEDGTSWVQIGKPNVEPPAVKQGISEPIVQVLPVRHRIRKALLGLGLLAGLAIIAFSLSDAQLGRDTGESCTTGFGKCTDEDRQAIQIIGIFLVRIGRAHRWRCWLHVPKEQRSKRSGLGRASRGPPNT